MDLMDYACYVLGIAVVFGMYWGLTSSRWHDLFHRNRARYMLVGRLVCARCVREWMVCLECGLRPCVCAARREAQEILVELERKEQG
jgi:hypothetical protein